MGVHDGAAVGEHVTSQQVLAQLVRWSELQHSLWTRTTSHHPSGLVFEPPQVGDCVGGGTVGAVVGAVGAVVGAVGAEVGDPVGDVGADVGWHELRLQQVLPQPLR